MRPQKQGPSKAGEGSAIPNLTGEPIGSSRIASNVHLWRERSQGFFFFLIIQQQRFEETSSGFVTVIFWVGPSCCHKRTVLFSRCCQKNSSNSANVIQSCAYLAIPAKKKKTHRVWFLRLAGSCCDHVNAKLHGNQSFAPNSASRLSSRIRVYPEDMIQK